ncbi:MAG: hypothetical protein ABIN25_10705 [Ginsengibacter sp.]
MTEQTLLNYFLNTATVDELKEDLKGSQQTTSYDTTSVYVNPIDTDKEFNVCKDHLIKLCDDAISGKLTTTDLNTIAFAIISSDFFTWDNETDDANLIETVIYDWDNPEIGFDITIKKTSDIGKSIYRQATNNLDKEELKATCWNDGK